MTTKTSAQIARDNGWRVGDVLDGVEPERGWSLRIRLTAIGEDRVLAVPDRPGGVEGDWPLEFRDWRLVERPSGMFRAMISGPDGTDLEGREVGDDWVVAQCGYKADPDPGVDCDVTTDGVPGSDLPGEGSDPESCARLVARLLNEWAAGGRL